MSRADLDLEEAHARLSPSGSKKWFSCPGSITLEAPIPNKSTTYSDDGTAMHEVAAWCLTEHLFAPGGSEPYALANPTTHRLASKCVGDYIVVSAKNEPVRKVLFTEDMADLVQGYVDTVRALSNGNRMLIEQRVDFSMFVGVAGQFGTADCVILDERQGEIMVVDLKTGHTPVEVDGNTQLMIYALGALAKLAAGAAVEKVEQTEEVDCDLA